MSEPRPANERHDSPDSGIMTHVRNSLRKNLGELSDEMLVTKIELIKKTRSLINSTNDLTVLRELNSFLYDVLLSDDDVKKINARITSVVKTITKNGLAWREFKRPLPDRK